LQESEELPVDFTQLFDHQLFKYSTDVIPEAVALYDQLNVKHEQLSLIPPQFEVALPPLPAAVFLPMTASSSHYQHSCTVPDHPPSPPLQVPLPPLQPAVFMPMMRELAPPALDLFDLDAEFSSEKLLLAQLTNKCTDEDLDYYVRESGEVMGVSTLIRGDRAEEAIMAKAEETPPEVHCKRHPFTL
jgi:intraflagellar transport protein 52